MKQYCGLFFFFKQKTAYEIGQWLEFRRVLFRSLCCNLVHFFWGPFLLAVLQRAMFVWRQKWVLVKSSNPLIFQHCLNGRGIHLRSIPLNLTYHGLEIQLFCYTINSQIMDNKNCLHTWSIPIIILYDDIFSRNWRLVTFCLVFAAG